MTEIRKTIINNIKNICHVKKIKNVDIAAYMGVSSGSVSNWFNGSNFMDVDNLYNLCQFLGVTMDQIFGITPIVYTAITDEEKNVLSAYRSADPVTQSNICKLLNIQEERDTENLGIS